MPLGSQSYKPTSVLSLPQEHSRIMMTASRIAGDVFKLQTDLFPAKKWALELKSTLTFGWESLLSRIGYTVKTHKPSLSVRLLHDCSGHPLSGYSSFLSRLLEPHLAKYPHMCIDTAIEDASELRVRPAPSDCR